MTSNIQRYVPPNYPTPSEGKTIYVNASAAAGGDGSEGTPFSTLEAAVQAVAGAGAGASTTTIVMREGTYYTGGIVLTHVHSGLTIQNYEGEDVAVSGAVPGQCCSKRCCPRLVLQ
jgi:pectin methylesterase-like acyl-CoA thioesterase